MPPSIPAIVLMAAALAVVMSAIGWVDAATTYDATIALSGWKYGKAVNCNRSTIVDWSCAPCGNISGMIQVQTFHNETTGGQSFVGYNTDTNTIVITFRGSVDIQNWINNLDFKFVDYPNSLCAGYSGSPCQVHQGFLNVYESIKVGTLAYVEQLWTQYGIALNPSILVTGHSLGGALTILAAADVSLQFKGRTTDIHIYTFGEPRVGNPAWAKWMSESVIVGGKQYRVTHEADPVPRLPPLEFGFLHVPHEVWYNNDLAGNTFTVCVDNATAEDYTNCENTQYAFVVDDHLFYMGIHAGCTAI